MKTVRDILIAELKRMEADGLIAPRELCVCGMNRPDVMLGEGDDCFSCVPAKLKDGIYVPMEET
jgi:hypothetical protein